MSCILLQRTNQAIIVLTWNGEIWAQLGSGFRVTYIIFQILL